MTPTRIMWARRMRNRPWRPFTRMLLDLLESPVPEPFYKRTVLLLALLLSACGGGGSNDDDAPALNAVIYSSPYHPSWPGSLAYTTTIDGTAYVYVRDDIDPDIQAIWPIIAHELWHVAGFHYHLAPPCVAAPDAVSAEAGPPCDDELAALALAPGVITIRAELPVHFAAKRAADYWNGHLGHELFRMGEWLPNQ